jgi:hypothetical protein
MAKQILLRHTNSKTRSAIRPQTVNHTNKRLSIATSPNHINTKKQSLETKKQRPSTYKTAEQTRNNYSPE